MNPAHRVTVLRMLIRNAEQLKAHLADCVVEAAAGPTTEYGRIYSRYVAAAHKLEVYHTEFALLQPATPAAILLHT